jgi:hypothetical protein
MRKVNDREVKRQSISLLDVDMQKKVENETDHWNLDILLRTLLLV